MEGVVIAAGTFQRAELIAPTREFPEEECGSPSSASIGTNVQYLLRRINSIRKIILTDGSVQEGDDLPAVLCNEDRRVRFIQISPERGAHFGLAEANVPGALVDRHAGQFDIDVDLAFKRQASEHQENTPRSTLLDRTRRHLRFGSGLTAGLRFLARRFHSPPSVIPMSLKPAANKDTPDSSGSV